MQNTSQQKQSTPQVLKRTEQPYQNNSKQQHKEKETQDGKLNRLVETMHKLTEKNKHVIYSF
jgi:hypothetical protein